MSTNIVVYDLDNFPDTSKTVVVDHKQVVPTGAWGDENWVLTAYTSATASGSASIQDVFIRTFTVGWAKSAGFNQGPYTITSTQRNMKVSINGSTFRTISLSPQTSAIAGTAVAEDMQTQINQLATVGASEAANLAFKNAWVTFENGRFLIQSGTPMRAYTGSNKSSVDVMAGDTYDVTAHLGFVAPCTSEDLAGATISETYLYSPYTVASGTKLDVDSSAVVVAGDCVGITDGTNTECRYVSSVSAGVINTNAAFTHDFATNSRVQKLGLQDPEAKPASVFESIDDVTRFAVATIINQIDFSS
jgi:hypothetical protein